MARSLKVNLLAILGGLLGVMCILLPWSVTSTDGVFGSTTTESVMTDYIHDGDSAFSFAIVLFLLGSALALLTPLGSVGQFFGWLTFLAAIFGDLRTIHTAIADITLSLGLGFVVGVVASALVIASLLRPLGLGYTKGYVGVAQRFLTVSP